MGGFISLFSAAVAAAPSIVSALKSLNGLLPKSPTSAATTILNGGAEVGLADVVAKAMPAATPPMFSTMKTEFGNAVAIFMTNNPGAALSTLDAPANVSTIEATAMAGIAKQTGLDMSKLPASAVAHLAVGAINAYKAGLGTNALSV